jgi:hypothetical protein
MSPGSTTVAFTASNAPPARVPLLSCARLDSVVVPLAACSSAPSLNEMPGLVRLQVPELKMVPPRLLICAALMLASTQPPLPAGSPRSSVPPLESSQGRDRSVAVTGQAWFRLRAHRRAAGLPDGGAAFGCHQPRQQVSR